MAVSFLDLNPQCRSSCISMEEIVQETHRESRYRTPRDVGSCLFLLYWHRQFGSIISIGSTGNFCNRGSTGGNTSTIPTSTPNGTSWFYSWWKQQGKQEPCHIGDDKQEQHHYQLQQLS